MEEKLCTIGMRDGGQCDGRETWYNWKERSMVDSAIEEKLGTTGRRDRWWTVRLKRN